MKDKRQRITSAWPYAAAAAAADPNFYASLLNAAASLCQVRDYQHLAHPASVPVAASSSSSPSAAARAATGIMGSFRHHYSPSATAMTSAPDLHLQRAAALAAGYGSAANSALLRATSFQHLHRQPAVIPLDQATAATAALRQVLMTQEVKVNSELSPGIPSSSQASLASAKHHIQQQQQLAEWKMLYGYMNSIQQQMMATHHHTQVKVKDEATLSPPLKVNTIPKLFQPYA